jgi:hypothetical protein
MRPVHSGFLAVLVLSTASVFAQALPVVQQTCKANIAPWFQSGSVTANGFVNPANSLNLNTSNNCNFYLWSQQMFMWMTSPASSIYGGNGVVFESPVFYAITSCGNSGDLCFVPQFSIAPPVGGSNARTKATASRLPPIKNARVLKHFQAAVRPAKRGPNGLPVVVDRKGRVIEITDAQLSPKGKPVVVGSNGKVEVSKITRDATTMKIQFIDAAGKVIANPKPVLSAALKKANAGQRFFTSDGTAIVVDSSGVVLDVSPEQAGSIGAVLLTQKNSIVYYTTVVNDVYAWFVTGVANGAINTNNQFPSTQSDLNQITAYAAKYGVTLTDANALTIEAKLSWVDASTLSNPSSYITAQAEVPVYNTSSPTSWPYTGSSTVKTLALLGVHVVGTSNGHPEMIWSTFEHFNNTPNGTYQYTNAGGGTSTQSQNTSGSWLLTANGSSGPFNVAHANYLKAPAITAQSGQTISGTNTLRAYAFGVAPTGIPNQNDATPAIANTEVISLNNSVLGQLASGDIRANYYFVGSTWTFSGFAPTQPYPVIIQQPNPNTSGSELGTSYLTNSTMETYQQATSTTPSTNCFSCHNIGRNTPPATPVTTAVSHIYGPLLSGASSTNAETATKKPTK